MSSVMQNLKLEQIRTDGGTQPRTELNESVVAEYAESITDGAKLPPITVFQDGSAYWLADGFHRFFAHKKIGAIDIQADVIIGTKRDAVLHSVGSNGSHGLRRTNADKRKAVETLLNDTEWAQWSDREVARQCGVGNKFVGDVRRSICVPNTDAPIRIVERKGKAYEQNTANIGKAKPIEPLHKDTPAEYAGDSSFDDDEIDIQVEINRLTADNEMMGKVFDADDKLGSAMAELKRATEENRVLRERVNGLMNEKNAAVKQAKMWRSKFEKLEKMAKVAA